MVNSKTNKKIVNTFIICGVLLSIVGCEVKASNNANVEFYGTDNQSALMTFTTSIDIVSKNKIEDAKEYATKIQKNYTKSMISKQVEHTFGVFTEHEQFKNNPGIIQTRGQTSIVSSTLINENTVRVVYKYSDKVVFKKKIFKNGPLDIEFSLPRDPKTIYAKGIPEGSAVNECTDEHYNSEGDFWYFWNPKKYGCPIKEEDLVTVKARLEPIPETTKTFPDYNKMYGNNGTGREFKIVFIGGIDTDFSETDLGRKTYNQVKAKLLKSGFALKSESKNERVLTKSTRDANFSVEMFFMDQGDRAFVEKSAYGMETADVFIYDGHSGLGGHLNVDRFEEELGKPLNLPKDKKQIFYFNGCSTYAYYNADFFDLKKSASDPDGINTLDIITTSVGAPFAIGSTHDAILINALSNGSRPSWQKIMDDLYKANPGLTALNHVNGDEDNPSTSK